MAKFSKLNLIEQIMTVFDDVNFAPLTITLPQNGDIVTLTPEFYETPSNRKDMSTFKALTVTGACMPISGSITYVVQQLRNYDKLIALRANMESKNQTVKALAPAYA